MFLSEQKSTISEYKKLYQSIGNIKCPYFGGERIFFNRKGFNHLLRRGRKSRFFVEQKERLPLLIYCKSILSTDHKNVEHRIVKKFDTSAFFWTFTARFDDVDMKLVIRQIGSNGQKHFFSIFPIKS